MQGSGYRAVKPYLDRLDEAARYYLPPGAYDGVTRLGGLAAMLSPGADLVDAGAASGALSRAVMERDPLSAVGAGAGLAAALGSAFLPGPSAGAVDEATDAARKGIRAYHGSPHDFDRFDISKIGTGEGAQAYGHGLYFAESEGVARNYRDTLSRPSFLERGDGAPIPGDLQRMFDDAWNDLRGTTYGADMQGAADLVMQKLDRQRANALKAGDMEWFDRVMDYRAEVGRIRDNPPPTAGRMYEVRINAEPDAFLDWDGPTTGNPGLSAMARQILEKAPPSPYMAQQIKDGTLTDKEAVSSFGQRGVDFYTAMRRRYGAGVAEEKLREAGIPGIKYLDAGSRSAGDGSRNYVVFDDSLVEIVRKYGLAGLIAMGALGTGPTPPPSGDDY